MICHVIVLQYTKPLAESWLSRKVHLTDFRLFCDALRRLTTKSTCTDVILLNRSVKRTGAPQGFTHFPREHSRSFFFLLLNKDVEKKNRRFNAEGTSRYNEVRAHLFFAAEFKWSFGFSYLRLHAVEVAIVPYEPPATPQTPHCTFRGTRQSKKCSTYYHDKGPNALFIRFIVIAGWSGLCPHSLAFGWLLISHCHLDAEFSKWVRVCLLSFKRRECH